MIAPKRTRKNTRNEISTGLKRAAQRRCMSSIYSHKKAQKAQEIILCLFVASLSVASGGHAQLRGVRAFSTFSFRRFRTACLFYEPGTLTPSVTSHSSDIVPHRSFPLPVLHEPRTVARPDAGSH